MIAYPLQVLSSAADKLLSHLEGVERHGTAWRARCPAHGSDRNRSLSVAAADDGRALLHCFSGCSALDVVHAVGLELSDLFEKRITRATTPAERRQLRDYAKLANWAAALEVLEFEARIVLVAADQTTAGKPLDTADRERLGLALERIESARRVLRGR